MCKNLIVFSFDFPPSNGGISRLCFELANEMDYFYEKVIVLTSRKNGPQNIKSNKFEIIYFPEQRVIREFLAWKYLFSLKEKNNYNIICGIWHPEALITLLARFRKVNVLAHGAELKNIKSFKNIFWFGLYAKSIFKFISVICNSKYTFGLVNKINSNTKARILPLAVNDKFFKPTNKKKNNQKIIFGSLSRIEKFKGYDFILRTLNTLPKRDIDNIEWHIAGKGPYLEDFKKDVSNSKLSDKIFFHGFIDNESLIDFYNSLDVFILCTRDNSKSIDVEGFGLVFLEAQACGIPTIGTKSGGIPCAIESDNGGWLIEQDSQNELFAIITSIIKTPEIIKVQGEKARKRVVDTFTWKMYCEKLIGIIK